MLVNSSVEATLIAFCKALPVFMIFIAKISEKTKDTIGKINPNHLLNFFDKKIEAILPRLSSQARVVI